MKILQSAVLVLAAATFAVPFAPIAAQTLSPELRALDEQLPGDLVNDPSRIDWESYGPDFYAESIVDPAIPGGGAARRFHVNRATEFIYTSGTNIPLIRDVKRGDQVTIGFWARTIEAATSDGKGVLRVRFQKDSPPYPGFGETTLEIDSEWDWYEVTATTEQALSRKDGIVAIQFGRTKQILEIGQAIVVSGASAVIDAAPPTAPAPAPVEAPALPGPLAGSGSLINDPTQRNWTIAATSGTSRSRDDASIWLGTATQLATGSGTGAEPMVQAMIEIPAELAQGEELLIAMAAKTVSASSADGRATLGVGLAAASGETLTNTAIALGSNWQLVRFVTRPPREFAAGQAAVVLTLSGADSAVDIGPVYVIRAGQ